MRKRSCFQELPHAFATVAAALGGFSRWNWMFSMTGSKWILFGESQFLLASCNSLEKKPTKLNDAAARLGSDMLKFTRFEKRFGRKTKRSVPMASRFGNDWGRLVAGDTDNDEKPGKQLRNPVRISGFLTRLPAGGGMPASTAITNAKRPWGRV